MAANNESVRAIAVLSNKRFDALGPVPTFKELGLDVLISSERGIAGPKALPDDIALRIQQAVKETIEDPVFVASVKNDASVLSYMPGAQWTKSLDNVRDGLKPFVKYMQD